MLPNMSGLCIDTVCSLTPKFTTISKDRHPTAMSIGGLRTDRKAHRLHVEEDPGSIVNYMVVERLFMHLITNKGDGDGGVTRLELLHKLCNLQGGLRNEFCTAKNLYIAMQSAGFVAQVSGETWESKRRTLGPWKGEDVKWEDMTPEQEQLLVWNALFECVKVLQDPYILYAYTRYQKTYYGAFVDFVMDENKLTFFRRCRPILKELLKVSGTMIRNNAFHY